MLTSVCCLRLRTFAWAFGCLEVLNSIYISIKTYSALENDDKYHPSGTMPEWREYYGISKEFYLAYVVINIVASAMLVVGALKKRHRFLVPWLINNGVIVACVFLLLLDIYINKKAVTLESKILPFVPFLAIEWYLYYGIYSFYKEIKASKYTMPGTIVTEVPNINSYPGTSNV